MILGLFFLTPFVVLVVLIALGVVFGARAAAKFVLVITGLVVLFGFAVLHSFLTFLGGIFR